MSYLLDRGWTPCLDATHPHREAGMGTLLHPPGDIQIYTPVELTTFDAAVMRGLPVRVR